MPVNGITLPERGQPMDVKFVYELANAVNNLAATLNDNTNAVSYFSNGTSDQPQSRRTGALKIHADVVKIAAGNKKAGQSEPWTLNVDFTYIPVAVATVVSNTSTIQEADVNVVITTVTSQQIKGNILYKKDGNLNVNINVIAVGIKN